MTIWVVVDRATPEGVVGYTDLSQALVKAHKKFDPRRVVSHAINDEWFTLEGKLGGLDKRVDVIKLPIRHPPQPLLWVGGG